MFNAVSVAMKSKGTMLEFGGGITATVTQSLSFFRPGGYGIGLDDSDATTVGSSVGLRFRW